MRRTPSATVVMPERPDGVGALADDRGRHADDETVDHPGLEHRGDDPAAALDEQRLDAVGAQRRQPGVQIHAMAAAGQHVHADVPVDQLPVPGGVGALSGQDHGRGLVVEDLGVDRCPQRRVEHDPQRRHARHHAHGQLRSSERTVLRPRGRHRTSP